MQNSQSEIVIVGMGAYLPGAESADKFFDNMIAGKCFTQPLVDLPDSAYRQRYEYIYNKDKSVPDSSYTLMGAPVDRRAVVELAKKHNLPLDDNYLLHAMTVEVVHQCITGVLPQDARGQTDIILGIINHASEGVNVSFNRVRRRIEKYGSKALLNTIERELHRLQPERDVSLSIPSKIGEKVRQHFGLGGMVMRLDAACASSLATVAVASMRLREGLARYAVVGGCEDGIGNINPLIAFSQLGVLAESNPVPFDYRADGMVMGEGACALLLTTMEEARRVGLPILAVIKGIGHSSDGKIGGLTEPTVPGQILCYQRAYGEKAPEKMAYLEAHGTGTIVGDRVELDSLVRYFAGHSAAIGSAKWSVGHMMGAAGAVGMLRAIGVMQRGIIPPNPYFVRFSTNRDMTLTVNKKPVTLEAGDAPINIGVSSFGFGGSNFHVWLQQYKPASVVSLPTAPTVHDVVLCAETEALVRDVPNLFRQTAYRLPPKAWPYIDKMQLLSVLLAEKVMRDNGIPLTSLDGDNVHVFSGATQGLDLLRDLLERLAVRYVLNITKNENPELIADIKRVETNGFTDMVEMNDQSMLGSLNGLIASRVTKAFDLRGMHFSIDADHASGLIALDTARSLLRTSAGVALVFDTEKHINDDDGNLSSTMMRCYLVASLPYALQHNLAIKSVLQPLTLKRGVHAVA